MNPILEPPNLEEFYEAVKLEFQHASTNFLADLHAFRGNPKESLTKLATWFNEVADPLVMHKQMSSRHLALHFANHISAYIRRTTVNQMKRLDKQRRKDHMPLVNKEELLRMAKDNETKLLESEAKQRAATLTPRPHSVQTSGTTKRDRAQEDGRATHPSDGRSAGTPWGTAARHKKMQQLWQGGSHRQIQ